MQRRALFALAALTLAVLGLAACAPQEKVDPAAQQAAEDLAWLKEQKPILDAKRQELQEIRDVLAGKAPAPEATAEGEAAEGEVAEGEGESAAPPPTPEEMEGHAVALEAEIDKLSQDLGEKVVSFINSSDIQINSAGNITSELTPDERFVVDTKIDEDMHVAQEYIDKGGDYGRAIDIYQVALRLDPDNQRLQDAIAEAEDMRWMTEERFKGVKKGMTQDEVREILGQVMASNVREFPAPKSSDKPVEGWFYKKKDGGAAGVYFQEKKKGEGDWRVYNVDFDAIKQQVVEGE